MAPSLTIKNVEVSDLDDLKLKMSDRRRTRGGPIRRFEPQTNRDTGNTKVKIVFEDDSGMFTYSLYVVYKQFGVTMQHELQAMNLSPSCSLVQD